VRVHVTVNVARTEDEAERQARGEDVLVEQTPGDEAEQTAAEVFEEGAAPADAGDEEAN
jgi:large subunit ribosomal protein L9